MSSFIAATVVTAFVATHTAVQARKSRKQAKREKNRIKAEEDAKQLSIDQQIRAEKLAANNKATTRLRRKGYAGTVLGGKYGGAEKLGSVN